MKTEEMPFTSSLHGRQRRSQRDITKRDLQAAVKYGVKEAGHLDRKTGLQRWKYTFQDIVYITDKFSTTEVTSWALELPLDKVELPPSYTRSYKEAKHRNMSNPEKITSHRSCS